MIDQKKKGKKKEILKKIISKKQFMNNIKL